jgi:hypothetical protein
MKCCCTYSVHAGRCAFYCLMSNSPDILWEQYMNNCIFSLSNIPALTSVSETWLFSSCYQSRVLATAIFDRCVFLEWFIWQAFIRRYTCRVFACSLWFSAHVGICGGPSCIGDMVLIRVLLLSPVSIIPPSILFHSILISCTADNQLTILSPTKCTVFSVSNTVHFVGLSIVTELFVCHRRYSVVE